MKSAFPPKFASILMNSALSSRPVRKVAVLHLLDGLLVLIKLATKFPSTLKTDSVAGRAWTARLLYTRIVAFPAPSLWLRSLVRAFIPSSSRLRLLAL